METTYRESGAPTSLNWSSLSNFSSPFPAQLSYPLCYQIIATILHSLIFVFGVAGNVVVILVITRSKSLHSPAYTYLVRTSRFIHFMIYMFSVTFFQVSLAVADLIVLVSTVPEAILGHYIGNQWLFGQIGCSLFIFSNFLGINAGSLRYCKVPSQRCKIYTKLPDGCMQPTLTTRSSCCLHCADRHRLYVLSIETKTGFIII